MGIDSDLASPWSTQKQNSTFTHSRMQLQSTLICSISWSEVIDNFVSVKKSQKSLQMASSTGMMSSSLSMSSLNALGSVSSSNSDEVKKISTPKVKKVTRKRPVYTREEKESRANNDKKVCLINKEDNYYLQINNDNLQMLKDHLEKIKLKMKEMKEKKKKKKS